jgi:hypothetical protein
MRRNVAKVSNFKEERRYMTTQEQQRTSTSNVEYDLISVIYHTLESALSASIYVTDAQWVGDQELARFFWTIQQEDRQAAEQAEYLLGQRLSKDQSSQSGQGQQSMYGQGGFGQGQFGGGYGFGPGMGGYGSGMYGGYGNPFGSGMYGGGYGFGPGMYGGYSYGPGMGGYGNQFGGYSGSMYSGQFGGGQFGSSGSATLRQVTGTSDVTYDLISTIYHALESAQTSATYLQDAQQAGDQEIVQFFQQMQQKCSQRAEQAKQFLAPRLSQRRWYQGGMSGSSYGGQGMQTGTSSSGTSTSTSQSSSSSNSGSSSQS